MLIKKPISLNEIVTIKLTSSEEVIGRLTAETDESITLSKPVCLQMTQRGPALVQWIMTADPERDVDIPKTYVIVTIPTQKEIVDMYVPSTTGISLV